MPKYRVVLVQPANFVSENYVYDGERLPPVDDVIEVQQAEYAQSDRREGMVRARVTRVDEESDTPITATEV